MRTQQALSAILILTLFYGQENVHADRHKRFLDRNSWSFWPESVRDRTWGHHAREIGERAQLWSQQATRTLDQLFADIHQSASSPVAVMSKDPSAGQIGKPVNERETEDGSVEAATYKPPGLLMDLEYRRPLIFNTWIPGHFPRSPLLDMLTPWWRGPNTCEDKSEVDESDEEGINGTSVNFSFQSTQCRPTESAYVCTKKIRHNGIRKTIISRHQCCHGYTKRTDGRPGCIELKMEDLLGTMKSLDASRFVQMAESVGLQERLLTENFTIFCPIDDAVMDFEDENEDNEISSVKIARRSTDMASLVNGHIVEGFHSYDSLDDEQVITSIDDKKIHINKYQGIQTTFTANCVPVTSKNNFAQNGIVHLIPEVLTFPTKSVAEIISNDPQFGILNKLLSKVGLMESLRDQSKTWTFFAPTDSAFGKMDQALFKRIQENPGCLNKTLKHHISKMIICSSTVTGRIHIQNLLENEQILTKDENEMLHIDGKQIVEKDILAINGIVNVIDDVLVPQQAKTILETLEETDRSDLLDLIESAELISTFSELQNVTFFVPSKDALQDALNSTLTEWKENPEKLRDVLLYHVTTPETTTSMLHNNQQITSLFDHQTIHIKLHEVIPGIATRATAQCSHITDHDNEVCGAVMHTIDKVLIPPKQNIIDVLQNMDGYDVLRKILQVSKLDIQLKANGPYTLLAPSDEAFSHLREAIMQEMLHDETKATDILKLHILPEILCCNGVSHVVPFHRQFVRTVDGSLLPLHRSIHNRVRFGRSRAVKCDIMTSNGVIHTINRVLLPIRHTIFGMDLGDIF